jgi:aminopeptidase N
MTDTQSPESLTVEEHAYKLPTNIRPTRYQLRLTPDLATFTFAGEEKVDIQVLEPTTDVVVNAAELQIHAVTVVTRDGQTLTGRVTLDELNERAIVTFPETLHSGPYQLSLTFSGLLNDKLHGFYRSMYKDTNGQNKILYFTRGRIALL